MLAFRRSRVPPPPSSRSLAMPSLSFLIVTAVATSALRTAICTTKGQHDSSDGGRQLRDMRRTERSAALMRRDRPPDRAGSREKRSDQRSNTQKQRATETESGERQEVRRAKLPVTHSTVVCSCPDRSSALLAVLRRDASWYEALQCDSAEFSEAQAVACKSSLLDAHAAAADWSHACRLFSCRCRRPDRRTAGSAAFASRSSLERRAATCEAATPG